MADESAEGRRTILIAAVPFSENLGDQVIAGCTEYLVHRALPSAAIEFLDFSGRRAKNEHSMFRASIATSVFYRTPHVLRPLVVAATLLPRLMIAQRRYWSTLILRADVILVGGGQLLQDVYLNFPLKLWAFSRLVKRAGKRYSLFSVGVDPVVTYAGARLFRAALGPDRLHFASCRDARSIAAFQFLSARDSMGVVLAPDPALFAPEVFAETPGVPGLVGVNIAHPSELATRAAMAKRFSRTKLLRLWTDVIRELISLGRTVQLFTNGSRADEEFAREISLELHRLGVSAGLELAPRPTSAGELSALVSRCDVLIAHRLHACILAVAYQRRVVPLAWDSKLEGFFTLLGRDGECIQPEDVSSQLLIDRTINGLPAIAADRIEQLKTRCADSLGRALRHDGGE